jgi:indole-3-glycerol phosphate synthase
MTFLDELLSLRKAAVQVKKTLRPPEVVRDAALRRRDIRDFGAALRSTSPAIVAEFKRASPSAGTINAAADPAGVAAAYERGGAVAISVLTEPQRFGGSFEDLQAARAAVSLPVLCKDFVVDAYQIWEAAAEGADAVLLIVAALGGPDLPEFIATAADLDLASLVEVHDEAEAERAVAAGARIIGVNNRDLRSFEVDVTTALRVRSSLPERVMVVAESGYRTAEQIAQCSRAGIDAVLVGETLMREEDPERAVSRLLGVTA